MFKLLKLTNNIKTTFFITVLFLCLFSLFTFQSSIFSGIKKGFTFCTDLLIPSLFLFMVFSEILLDVSIHGKIPKILSTISKKLFRLPGSCSLAILTGLLGGYPTGAANTKILLEKNAITKKQGEYLCYFLIGAGPAFTINVVGTCFFGNRKIGVFIFLAQFLASIILGIVLAKLLLDKKNIFNENGIISKNISKKNLLNIFITSVNRTSKNLFYMCSFVVFFSAVLGVIQKIIENGFIISLLNTLKIDKSLLNSIIALLFEVTSGCNLSIEHHLPIYFLIFAVSWAGISVHMQIFYILKGVEFSKLKFIFFRFIHSIIATAIFYLLLLTLNESSQTSTVINSYNICASSFKSVPASVSLITMCMCFIAEATEKICKLKIK